MNKTQIRLMYAKTVNRLTKKAEKENFRRRRQVVREIVKDHIHDEMVIIRDLIRNAFQDECYSVKYELPDVLDSAGRPLANEIEKRILKYGYQVQILNPYGGKLRLMISWK